jgi:hypothetical protein
VRETVCEITFINGGKSEKNQEINKELGNK